MTYTIREITKIPSKLGGPSKWGPNFNWYKDGSAEWGFGRCNEPNLLKRLVVVLSIFKNFRPEIFGYTYPTPDSIESKEYVKVKTVQDIENFYRVQPLSNQIYGKIKVKTIDEKEVWLDGVEISASRLEDNGILIRLYRDDWFLGDVSFESLEEFNNNLKAVKETLKPKEVDCGKLVSNPFNALFDEEHGFLLEQIQKARDGKI